MATYQKKCKLCSRELPYKNFISTGSKFFPDSFSDICTDCLCKKMLPTDLNTVDKVLQYLDLPLYPDIWVQTYEDDEDNALPNYCTKVNGKEYRNIDWTNVNQMWKSKITAGTMTEDLALLNEDWISEMKKKWGNNYSYEQLHSLEDILADTFKKQNIVTDMQLYEAKIICMNLLSIEDRARNGESVTKELKEIVDAINKAGFEAKNTRSYSDFESIGELINHCVRKGYRPNFYKGEENDIVDLTIKNQQAYLRRLVAGEPGLVDLVESRKEAIKVAEKLEELDEADDGSADLYSNGAMETLTYEDEESFNHELE